MRQKGFLLLFSWPGNQVWNLNKHEGEFWQSWGPERYFFSSAALQYALEESVSAAPLQLATIATLRTIPTRHIIFSSVSSSNKANNPLHCDKNYLHESKVLQSIQLAFLLSSHCLILLSLNPTLVLLHAFLIKYSVPRNSAVSWCCLSSINLIFLGFHCTLSSCSLSHVCLHCNCPGAIFLYVPATARLQS